MTVNATPPQEDAPYIIPVTPDIVLPQGQDWWTSPEMSTPLYASGETAKVFFGKSPNWLRWRLDPAPGTGETWAVLNGEKIEVPRNDAGFRKFRLYDIERLAHAFVQKGAIEGGDFLLVIRMVKAQAQIYRWLD